MKVLVCLFTIIVLVAAQVEPEAEPEAESETLTNSENETEADKKEDFGNCQLLPGAPKTRETIYALGKTCQEKCLKSQNSYNSFKCGTINNVCSCAREPQPELPSGASKNTHCGVGFENWNNVDLINAIVNDCFGSCGLIGYSHATCDMVNDVCFCSK